MFDWIERYKFGIIATLMVYIAIFMYLQMDSYDHYFEIRSFTDGAYVKEEPELEIDRDNIQIPQDFEAGDIKNMANDVNDSRKRSYEDYAYNNNAKDVEQSVRDLEKQFYNEAGGDAERKKLEQQMKDRQEKQTTSSTTNNNNTPSNNGGDIAYKGKTMVDYSLKDRQPFQNNKWYVRNPGYTCGYGSGVVHIDIKVNQNGNVTTAEYNPSKSNGASTCMIEKAIEYAKKSRFAYSSKAPSSQSGWILYTFVSQ